MSVFKLTQVNELLRLRDNSRVGTWTVLTPPVANGDAVIPGTMEEEGHHPAGTSSLYYLWEPTEQVRLFPLKSDSGKRRDGVFERLLLFSSSAPPAASGLPAEKCPLKQMFLPRKQAEDLLKRDGERR